MKTLPSLREKKRYIFFKVHADEPIPYQTLKDVIMDGLIEFLGERGLARSKVRLIKNLWKTDRGVLQTTPKAVDEVKVALALIHQIGDQRVLFQTLRVSGTIKAGKTKAQ